MTIKIATRSSPLALWQAEYVAAWLQQRGKTTELVKITTKADRFLDTTLDKIGGKGLFVKELEQSLLDGHTDLAVHSMKDVPMDFPEGLGLSCILARENPFDAFVSDRYDHPDQLPAGSRVGTSSLRRKAQLAHRYPELDIVDLRGNVNTRLGKLQAGQFDAIILANAGLKRLQLQQHVRYVFDSQAMLPAIGQGAIGIETRLDDVELQSLLQPLADTATTQCVTAERAMNKALQGGCHMPVAGFAQVEEHLTLQGFVGYVDGQAPIYAHSSGSISDPEAVGQAVAEQLRRQGADQILAHYRNE